MAGKIVIANDEWTLSNTGYSGTNDPGQFVQNVASWFGGRNFLAFSNNFGLTESSLASTLANAGYSWAVTTESSYLSNLSAYSGIFLSGNAVDNNLLINYVNSGGNVYLAGGTGIAGPSVEAAQWATFLNYFGLGFVGSSYNGIGGSIPISKSHPIFNGVDSLYQNYGNSILDLSVDLTGQVVVYSGGQGLYAVYEATNASAPVSESATLILLGAGLIGLAGYGRKKLN